MRITESGLRRLIREEVRALREAEGGELPPPGVTAFFMDGGRAPVELADRADLLPLLLASKSRYPSVTFVAPDPRSYDPDLLEVGGVSFEVIDGAPPGWESIAWWWPLPPGVDASSKAAVMRSPRYRSALDAASVSLQERGGESLRFFGRAAGLPEVGLRVVEAWEDGDPDLLPAGFSRGWWRDLVAGLEPSQGPVEWIGSDDQMVR